MRLGELLRKRFDMSVITPLPAGAKEEADEMAASDMIPYTVHYDDNTIMTKDDGLVQVIRLDGLYFDSLSAQQIKRFERHRNTILRSIANSNRGIYVHLIRRKQHSYPAGEGQTWFSRIFNEAWRQKYQRKSFYTNEIYISIVRNRFRDGTPGWIDRIVNTVAGQRIRREDTDSFNAQAKDIYEASDFLLATLSDYGARRLTIQRLPHFMPHEQVPAEAARKIIARFQLGWDEFRSLHGQLESYPGEVLLDYLGEDYTELGEFFHYLINLEQERVPVTQVALDKTLAVSRLNFKAVSNIMEVQGLATRRAAAVVSMAEWPARTPSHMMDEFLKLPVEFIVTQSFFFSDRIHAEADMKLEKRRITVNDSEGLADEDAEELKKGLQDLTRGRSVNGFHHLTMLAHVPVEQHIDNELSRQHSLAALDEAVGLLKKAFVGLGVKAVREQFGVETFYWSQLPGQSLKFIGRRGKIKSANFAGFASLHNFAAGKIDGNLWGPAIMPFETESLTAYNFNFHREMEGMVSGHLGMTADTGSGKTTLLAALITMADKANPRVFWFDNRHGAKVFMAAMGGQHTTLSVLGTSGWNPFHLPDTPENRLYLVELLSLMRTCYGGKLVPDDIERFRKAVDENYSFDHLKDRRLRNISWCFGVGSELDKDMAIWHGANGVPGTNWGVFDNTEDNIDFTACRHYCFEMQQLQKDGKARPELPVILSYPFHRIEQAMNGHPFILVLEEGQNLVRHAYWRDKIDEYIMQIRRKNGILIFVTPDAKYLYSETRSIQKQTVTKIYLPNDKYSRQDMVDELQNTEAEFQFLLDNVKTRKFIIKRGNESVKAIFDLGDMKEFIPVLSSNDKGVALMEKVMSELSSTDPERWVPVFMQRSLSENTHNL